MAGADEDQPAAVLEQLRQDRQSLVGADDAQLRADHEAMFGNPPPEGMLTEALRSKLIEAVDKAQQRIRARLAERERPRRDANGGGSGGMRNRSARPQQQQRRQGRRKAPAAPKVRSNLLTWKEFDRQEAERYKQRQALRAGKRDKCYGNNFAVRCSGTSALMLVCLTVIPLLLQRPRIRHWPA